MTENKPPGSVQIKVEGNETLTRLLSELAKIRPIDEIRCDSEGVSVEWGGMWFRLTSTAVAVDMADPSSEPPVVVQLTGDPVADVQTILDTAQVHHTRHRIAHHESMADYHSQCAAHLRTELARGGR